jgi:hypothetical protein
MRGDSQSDWCNSHLDGDAVGFDVRQHAVDVEPAMQPHPDAGLQRRHDVEQAEDVRRRCGDLDPVARGQTQRATPMPHGGVQ